MLTKLSCREGSVHSSPATTGAPKPSTGWEPPPATQPPAAMPNPARSGQDRAVLPLLPSPHQHATEATHVGKGGQPNSCLGHAVSFSGDNKFWHQKNNPITHFCIKEKTLFLLFFSTIKDDWLAGGRQTHRRALHREETHTKATAAAVSVMQWLEKEVTKWWPSPPGWLSSVRMTKQKSH